MQQAAGKVGFDFSADDRGLICGFRFRPGEPGVPLALNDAADWLREHSASADEMPREDGSFIWLHFNLADASAERWMQQHAALPAEFYEALRQGSRSTRIEDAQDHLLAVVNDVAFEFSFDPSEIETLWINVGPRIAVTARVHP
ncbi:MAG TPA: CorA family divalent cation transporter, partial [Burkholderiaceae bacterium]